MIALPPNDARLPGLPIALDGQAIRGRLALALPDCVEGRVELLDVEPNYVRYKPATNCLVGYRLSLLDLATGQTDELPAHLRLYANDKAARIWSGRSLYRLVERSAHTHPGPLAARAGLLADLGGLIQVYPVDRSLRQLVLVSQRSEAGRLLADATTARLAGLDIEELGLVRYKPARKALLHYRLRAGAAQDWGREAYAKTYADDRAPRMDRLIRRLRASGVPLPEPLGASEEHRVGFQAAAAGVPLLELRGHGRYEAALGGVVDALARLHAVSPADLGHDLPAPSAGYDAWLLKQAAETLATLLPDDAVRVRRLADEIASELEGLPPAEPRPIHGDFYDDQVLVGDGTLTLLDLDEVRLGDPLTDVGNFLGHVSAKLTDEGRVDASREAFLGAWASRTGGDRCAPLLHEAAALILMAVGPFRRLEADWPDGIRRHLDLAADRLREFRRRTPQASTAAVDETALDPLLMEPILSGLPVPSPVQVRRAEVIRHKVGRRCTVRYELEVGPECRQMIAYAKLFASERAPRVHAALEALTTAVTAPAAPRLPQPLGCMPQHHLIVIGEVPGVPCVDRLAAGDVGLARSVAEALHVVHAADARLPRDHRLTDEIEPLAAGVERLSVTVPELAGSGRAALEALGAGTDRDWAWRTRPLHRDFYPEQVLVDGEAIGFVDLDDAAMGEPAVDVANFVAHLRLLAMRRAGAAGALATVEDAFLERYASLDPELDPALVRFLVGATCLRLAEIHVGRTRGPWLAHQLVKEAHRCLPKPLAA
jgi:Ser/Thr protein kinase RdoA (MazF antagonist)